MGLHFEIFPQSWPVFPAAASGGVSILLYGAAFPVCFVYLVQVGKRNFPPRIHTTWEGSFSAAPVVHLSATAAVRPT